MRPIGGGLQAEHVPSHCMRRSITRVIRTASQSIEAFEHLATLATKTGVEGSSRPRLNRQRVVELGKPFRALPAVKVFAHALAKRFALCYQRRGVSPECLDSVGDGVDVPLRDQCPREVAEEK